MDSFEKALHLMETHPIFLYTTYTSTIVHLLCTAITKFIDEGQPEKAAICHQYIALAQYTNTHGKIQAARNFTLAADLHTNKNDKMTCYQHAMNIYKEVKNYDDTIVQLEQQLRFIDD